MWKRCPVCGEIFNAKKVNAIFCSAKCRRRNATVLMSTSTMTDYAKDNLYETEEYLSDPPTQQELLEMVNVLRDFGVDDFNDMYDFSSRHEMNRWKMVKINHICM